MRKAIVNIIAFGVAGALVGLNGLHFPSLPYLSIIGLMLVVQVINSSIG